MSQPSWELPKWPLGVMVSTGLLKKQSSIWGDIAHPGFLRVVPTWRAGGEFHASDSWISTAVLQKSSVPFFLHKHLTCGYFTPICYQPIWQQLDKSKCVGTNCPGILCGMRRDSALHACVTSLRGWSPSPSSCSVGLLFVTCLFSPCCQQISRTHYLKHNSGLELAPIHWVGLASLHIAIYTRPKIFFNFSKDIWKTRIYSRNKSSNKADWVLWVVTGFVQISVSQVELHSPLTWMFYLGFLEVHLQKQHDYKIQISSSGLFFREGYFLCLLPFWV